MFDQGSDRMSQHQILKSLKTVPGHQCETDTRRTPAALRQVTAHAAAFVDVRAFCAGGFSLLYDIDICKYRFQFSAAAPGAFDAPVLPVAY
jgi:hypothetical protein